MTEFVVLAAGMGTRMRERTDGPKPLVELDGRPILDHTLERIGETDPDRVTVVVGYEGDAVESHLTTREYGFPVRTVRNDAYDRRAGYSLLRAGGAVDDPFVLAMADHLADPGIYRRAAAHDGLGLCVDDSPPPGENADEATTVRVEDGHIAAIGRGVGDWDAVDTGVFRLTPVMFDALEERTTRHEVTISDGVRRLIERGLEIEPIDVSGQFWIDVDTPADLETAEGLLSDGPRA